MQENVVEVQPPILYFPFPISFEEQKGRKATAFFKIYHLLTSAFSLLGSSFLLKSKNVNFTVSLKSPSKTVFFSPIFSLFKLYNLCVNKFHSFALEHMSFSFFSIFKPGFCFVLNMDKGLESIFY